MSNLKTPETPGAELLSIPEIGEIIDLSTSIYNLVRHNPRNPDPIPGFQTRITPQDGVLHLSSGRRAAGAYPEVSINPLYDPNPEQRTDNVVGVILKYTDVVMTIETVRSLGLLRDSTQRVSFDRSRLAYKVNDDGQRFVTRTPLSRPPGEFTAVTEGDFMKRYLENVQQQAHMKRRRLLDILLGHAA